MSYTSGPDGPPRAQGKLIYRLRQLDNSANTRSCGLFSINLGGRITKFVVSCNPFPVIILCTEFGIPCQFVLIVMLCTGLGVPRKHVPIVILCTIFDIPYKVSLIKSLSTGLGIPCKHGFKMMLCIGLGIPCKHVLMIILCIWIRYSLSTCPMSSWRSRYHYFLQGI